MPAEEVCMIARRLLYLIADRPSILANNSEFCNRVLRAVQGGVSAVQFRDQEDDLASTIKAALLLQAHLRPLKVPLIVNTRHSAELAHAVGAAGVFLEKEGSIADLRRELGPRVTIGTRFQSEEAALADYLSVKVFHSKETNPGDRAVFGLEGLDEARALDKPLLAIGGIDPSNAQKVWEALGPLDGIAMAGPLLRAPDPSVIAREILSRVQV